MFEGEVSELKDIKPDRVVGHMQYCEVHNKTKDSNDGSIPLTVHLTFSPKKSTSKAKEASLRTRLLDQTIKILSKAVKDKEIKDEDILPVIEELDDNYLPVQNLKLAYAQERNPDKVPEIADKLINSIDQQALAVYFGTVIKNKTVKEELEDEDPEVAKKSKEMRQEKDSLVNALHAKLVYELKKENDDEIIKTMEKLRKWVDTTEEKYALEDIKFDRRRKRVGAMLKKLNKLISDGVNTKNEKELFYIRREIVAEQGWYHWIVYFDNMGAKSFPSMYPPF